MERLTIDEVIAHCKRIVQRNEETMSKEAFETDDMDSWFMKEYWEHRQVAEWLEQLKAYKDAEEQGLLLRLPCKVGDTVYFIYHDAVHHEEVKRFFQCNGGTNWGIVLWGMYPDLYFDQIGKTVFLTKEEAEQALADAKGGA